EGGDQRGCERTARRRSRRPGRIGGRRHGSSWKIGRADNEGFRPPSLDAAQVLGATYRGRTVGTVHLAGCFSLQSSKSVASGEGGLLVPERDGVSRRAHAPRMFGEASRPEAEATSAPRHAPDGTRAYYSAAVGWNYRTTLGIVSTALAFGLPGHREQRPRR